MDMICMMGLQDWRSLHKVLTTLTEEQIYQMLDHELNNKRRKMMVLRLHQRWALVRAKRERKELLKQLGEDDDE